MLLSMIVILCVFLQEYTGLLCLSLMASTNHKVVTF